MSITYNSKEEFDNLPWKHWQPKEDPLLRSQDSLNSSYSYLNGLWVIHLEFALTECTPLKFFSRTFLPTEPHTVRTSD